MPSYILAVAFGHDEGNVFVPSPCVGVIDNQRAVLCKYGRKLLGSFAARRKERDVDLFVDDVFLFQFDDRVFFTHEVDFFARALCGSVKIIRVHGQFAFGEDFEEFAADHSRHADDGYVDFSHKYGSFFKDSYIKSL